MPYPNSTPEFRIVLKNNGLQELQVRYINEPQGYKSKWQNIPIVKESEVK
jgi:hypothetical protein